MYTPTDLSEEYWNERYKLNETGWDIGYAAPALMEYCSKLKDKHIAILVPGCGYGHEVVELISMGFDNITVIDLSTEALNALRQKVGEKAKLIHGNFFDHQGQYDLIIEQTFFCALDPSMRKKYAEHMGRLLKPGGKLMGVLFNRQFEGGPPFGGDILEYENLFSPLFEILNLAPCYNSIKPREGSEVFVELKSKEK